ncbi:MAG: hypothetical protein M3R65_00085, partial [Gemmatimonadota bacterium]|nr:hypothetical protein [Gemmatimonadota bacterium]
MTNRAFPFAARSTLHLAGVRNILLAGTLLLPGTLAAQATPTTLLGGWRAEAALPNGVVQTFRFDSGGAFELAMTVDVDGTYTATGNRLIETVALANTGA